VSVSTPAHCRAGCSTVGQRVFAWVLATTEVLGNSGSGHACQALVVAARTKTMAAPVRPVITTA